MTRSLILFSLWLTLGCGAGTTLPENGHTSSGPERESKQHPPATSAEELVKNYREAFAAGDQLSIEKMVYWEGPIEEETKGTVLKLQLSTGTAGESIFTKADLRPVAEGDVKPWAKLEADAVFDYTVSDKADTFNKSTYVPIVQVDGHYFFYVSMMPENYTGE